jgi:hypothetical protein
MAIWRTKPRVARLVAAGGLMAGLAMGGAALFADSSGAGTNPCGCTTTTTTVAPAITTEPPTTTVEPATVAPAAAAATAVVVTPQFTG